MKNTAYLVAWMHASEEFDSVVVTRVGIFSDPCPTAAFQTGAPFILDRVEGVDYQAAWDTMWRRVIVKYRVLLPVFR